MKRFGLLFLVVVFMWTAQEAAGMGTAPPERDPHFERKFEAKPAGKLDSEDVRNVKNMDQIINSEVQEALESLSPSNVTLLNDVLILPPRDRIPENAPSGTLFFSGPKNQLYFIVERDYGGYTKRYCVPLLPHQEDEFNWRYVGPEYAEPDGIFPVFSIDVAGVSGIVAASGNTYTIGIHTDCRSCYYTFIYLVRVADNPSKDGGPWAWNTNRLKVYPYYVSDKLVAESVDLTFDFDPETNAIVYRSSGIYGPDETIPPGCYGLIGEAIKPSGEKIICRLEKVIFSVY